MPAYAATVHKSQGSQYPAVVVPVLTQHYAILQRNLLYTGVTRGRQRLRAKAPAGRWQTTTFLAALRHDRIDSVNGRSKEQ